MGTYAEHEHTFVFHSTSLKRLTFGLRLALQHGNVRASKGCSLIALSAGVPVLLLNSCLIRQRNKISGIPFDWPPPTLRGSVIITV